MAVLSGTEWRNPLVNFREDEKKAIRRIKL
jgi:hypothetical protein